MSFAEFPDALCTCWDYTFEQWLPNVQEIKEIYDA
jgi:hypothetical protein